MPGTHKRHIEGKEGEATRPPGGSNTGSSSRGKDARNTHAGLVEDE